MQLLFNNPIYFVYNKKNSNVKYTAMHYTVMFNVQVYAFQIKKFSLQMIVTILTVLFPTKKKKKPEDFNSKS